MLTSPAIFFRVASEPRSDCHKEEIANINSSSPTPLHTKLPREYTNMAANLT